MPAPRIQLHRERALKGRLSESRLQHGGFALHEPLGRAPG